MENFLDELSAPGGLFYTCFGDLLHRSVDLNTLQMSIRAALVFVLAMAMVRVAGRRAIGMRTPFDTVVSLLLGALLSRAIVGASSFVGVVVASLVLVTSHRIVAWISARQPAFGQLINGKSRLLYSNGHLYRHNMRAALLTEADLLSALRQRANVSDFGGIEAAYMEANGCVSIVKRQEIPLGEPSVKATVSQPTD